jgi:hypothetical protein
MNCNCSDWDDKTPCKIHPNGRATNPTIRCETTIVVNIYRRYTSKKWFYTVVTDAIRVFTSQEFDAKPKVKDIIKYEQQNQSQKNP